MDILIEVADRRGKLECIVKLVIISLVKRKTVGKLCIFQPGILEGKEFHDLLDLRTQQAVRPGHLLRDDQFVIFKGFGGDGGLYRLEFPVAHRPVTAVRTIVPRHNIYVIAMGLMMALT